MVGPFGLQLEDIFSDELCKWRWTRNPFSQRELRAAAALGAVLDRRAWWVRWARRQDLRAAWLAEIEVKLVTDTVAQLVTCWTDDGHYWTAYHVLRKLCRREWIPVRDVAYPPPDGYPFDDGSHCESDGEEEDVDEDQDGRASGFHTSSESKSLWEKHKKVNTFLQVLWYVKMEVLRAKLRELPANEWTKQRLQRMFEDMEVADRDAVLCRMHAIIETTRGHTSLATTRRLVASLFPEESRDDVCELLALHLLKIRCFLTMTLQNVERVLKLTTDTLSLPSDKPLAQAGQPYYTPGPVPRTWLSDNAVQAHLNAKILREVSELRRLHDAARPPPCRESPVYHLVDPTLHCAVVGETKVIDIRVARGGTAASHMRDAIFADVSGVFTIEGTRANCQCYENAKYIRIPSEIDVSHDGEHAAFRSYINNLHPRDHAPLYNSLASLFVRFVPLFDQVVSVLGIDIDYKHYVVPKLSGSLGGTRPSSSLRRLVPPGLFEASHLEFTLKGSRCRVIVQIDEIALTPNAPRHVDESWHIDGVDAERVVATGIYCAASENVTDPTISFRMPVHRPGFSRWDNVAIDVVYELHDTFPLHQAFGRPTLKPGRCLAYPSIFESSMSAMELIDVMRPGTCVLVKIMLVDPIHRSAASTETVAPQQDAWLKRELELVLTRPSLPDSVVSRILSSIRLGQTPGEALDARRKLVEERAVILDKRVADREYRYRW